MGSPRVGSNPTGVVCRGRHEERCFHRWFATLLCLQLPLWSSWLGYSALTRATQARVPVAEFFTMAAVSLGVFPCRGLMLLPKCGPRLVSQMWASVAEAPEAEVCIANVAKASETTVSGTSVVQRFRNKFLQDNDALAERSKAVAQGAIPKWVRTPQASLFLLKRGWWLQLTASDTLFQGCCQRPTLTLVAQSV